VVAERENVVAAVRRYLEAPAGSRSDEGLARVYRVSHTSV
jgi:hypothetical protein